MHTMDAHPNAEPPYRSFLAITKIIPITDATDESNPTYDAMFNGVWEKETIPSIEYFNKLQKFQLVLPATRSLFWYSRYFVLNPPN